jgi:hypothetical protein
MCAPDEDDPTSAALRFAVLTLGTSIADSSDLEGFGWA